MVLIVRSEIYFLQTGVQIFVEHWRGNLQFYPTFALFSTLGGMNLDQGFFQVSKLSEDQKKKGLHQNWNIFSPSSAEDQKEGLRWAQVR